MPPRKRPSSRDEDNDGTPTNLDTPETRTVGEPGATGAKRRRVSLACNPCRAAREKCDGGRPHCGSCTAQHRPCAYTVSSKKRGVQTGYLRTIELALAWVLEEVPEGERALQRLLTENGGREGAKVLTRKNSAGHQLHKKWNRSRVHQSIARLLTESEALCTEPTPEESDSGRDDDNTPTASSIRSDNVDSSQPLPAGAGISPRPAPMPPTRLKLPRHWSRLVDIYCAYTHCWLPLLDKSSLVATASTYPPDGLPGDEVSLDSLPSSHLELWSAMALASFQDNQGRANNGGQDNGPPAASAAAAAAVFSTLQSLLSRRQGTPDWAYTRATILHGLILMGQGNLSTAWLLIGTAMRASLFLRTVSGGTNSPRSQMQQVQQAVTMTACSVLDVWLSLALGQHPQVSQDSHDIWQPDHILSSICSGEEEAWYAVPGVGNDVGQNVDVSPSAPISQPFSTLLQLSKFTKIISASVRSKPRASLASLQTPPEKQQAGPEDLTKSLDPKFAFCNSLMGTTPALPSAFVLQAAFLAGTVALSSTCRPSVLSTFTEVIENALSHFGPSGSPPILQVLMDFMRRQARTNSLGSIIALLREVWTTRPLDHDLARGRSQRNDSQHGWLDSREQAPVEDEDGRRPHVSQAPSSALGNYLPPHSNFRPGTVGGSTRTNTTAALDSFIPLPTSNASTSSSYGTPGTERLYTIATPQSYGQSQMMDYDTILDQLGSIDCSDSLELDPQFMVNLGFAPGCGFGDPGFDEG